MTIWLILHVLGVVLFLGNIITAAFWKLRAEATRKPEVVHHAVKNVMLADFVFTIPGLVLVTASGMIMAYEGNLFSSGFNWLLLSVILFGVTGVIWSAVLLPLQRAMIRLSEDGIHAGELSPAFRQASRRWDYFGIVSTLVPVAVLILMIAKGF